MVGFCVAFSIRGITVLLARVTHNHRFKGIENPWFDTMYCDKLISFRYIAIKSNRIS